jgi:hypothetical protein
MHGPCDVCDFRDPAGPTCHARAAGVRRYCDLIAAGRADYARLVRERTTGIPEPGPPDPPAVAPADVEAGIRLAMAVELCPHGSGPCGCGSGPPRLCSHPDHPDEVRKTYCLQCPVPQAA